jgi:hypothetical protein
MKFKYFSYIAEQSFKTSPSGERLFFYNMDGFWSKPYIIPNEETEKRLFKKQLWVLRIFLGILILGQPFLFMAMPSIIYLPLGYILYLLTIMLLFWVVSSLVFRNDISTLKRTDAPIPLAAFYRDTAKRHSPFALFLGFLASIGFVIAGLWVVNEKINGLAGWGAIVMGVLCAIAWGYMLYLKFNMPENKESVENKDET